MKKKIREKGRDRERKTIEREFKGNKRERKQ